MNKRGLSGVVATVLMIGLVVVAVVIVWNVVNGVVENQVEETESCFGIFGKVSLNSAYTCYSSGNLQLSVSVGDITIDGLVIQVSSVSESNTYTLSREAQTISGIIMYNGTTTPWAPGENSGITYNVTLASQPDSIKIAPIIGGNQCDTSDEIQDIPDCNSLI